MERREQMHKNERKPKEFITAGLPSTCSQAFTAHSLPFLCTTRHNIMTTGEETISTGYWRNTSAGNGATKQHEMWRTEEVFMAGWLVGPKRNGGEPKAWWLVNEAGQSNPTEDAKVKATAGSERNLKVPEELQPAVGFHTPSRSTTQTEPPECVFNNRTGNREFTVQRKDDDDFYPPTEAKENTVGRSEFTDISETFSWQTDDIRLLEVE